MNTKKKKQKVKPADEHLKVNPQLDGLSIKINSFGEIQSNIDIDKINKFLNENLADKKLA